MACRTGVVFLFIPNSMLPTFVNHSMAPAYGPPITERFQFPCNGFRRLFSTSFQRNLTKAQRALTAEAPSCFGWGLLSHAQAVFMLSRLWQKTVQAVAACLRPSAPPIVRSPASGFRRGRNGISGIDVLPIADGSPGPIPGAVMSDPHPRLAYSTPFGHAFHADSATDSRVIRPGGRSEATLVFGGY